MTILRRQSISASMLSACPNSECFVQATYQIFIAEGLAQKSYRSGAERVASRLRFREGSDKDNGNAMPLGDKMTLQLYARHARHLDIRDQAIGIIHHICVKKRIGRCKGCGRIAERADEAYRCVAE